MTNENPELRSEDVVCDCFGAPWSPGPSGWHCSDCGQWLCSVTGRESVRDPEPLHQSLKSVAQAYIRKHGSEEWTPLGYIKTEDFVASFTETDQTFLTQWYREHFSDLPSDDDRRDEVS
jgi:hypothetical protein